MKNINPGWGNRLKKFRTLLQFNQSKFAEVFDLEHQANVSRYESEENFPSFDIIFKLYEFGLNLNWWASGVGDMIRYDADIKNSAIPQNIKNAIDYAKAFYITYQLRKKENQKGEIELKLGNETAVFKDIIPSDNAEIIIKNMRVFVRTDKES